jgi:hypothetical protein
MEIAQTSRQEDQHEHSQTSCKHCPTFMIEELLHHVLGIVPESVPVLLPGSFYHPILRGLDLTSALSLPRTACPRILEVGRRMI